MWILLFLWTALAWAQPAGAPKPVFPDDSQDPKQAGGAELLEAVCPGHVVVGKDIECKASCPEDAGFPGLDWTLERALRGHFLSPTSDDAVLSMSGCEPHSFNFGGTILLTVQSGKWKMLWYKGGVPTANCHRTKLPGGREILTCLGGTNAQGWVSTELYLEDLLAPKVALMAGHDTTFFSVEDTTARCGDNLQDESKPLPLTRGFIERVQFQAAPDGTFRGLSVFAHRGERDISVAQVQECINEGSSVKPHRGLDFRPPTKPYRVDFKFDGGRMVRVGNSPAPK